MTDDFRDFDPEDAYDAGDPTSEKLSVLERVVEHLRSHLDDDRTAARRDDALRLVEALGRLRGGEARRLNGIRRALEEM